MNVNFAIIGGHFLLGIYLYVWGFDYVSVVVCVGHELLILLFYCRSQKLRIIESHVLKVLQRLLLDHI